MWALTVLAAAPAEGPGARAEAAWQAGRWTEAANAWADAEETLRPSEQGRAALRERQARAWLLAGQPSRALALLAERTGGQTPSPLQAPTLWCLRLAAEARAAKWPEAAATARGLLETHPRDPAVATALLETGAAAEAAGKPELAAGWYAEVQARAGAASLRRRARLESLRLALARTAPVAELEKLLLAEPWPALEMPELGALVRAALVAGERFQQAGRPDLAWGALRLVPPRPALLAAQERLLGRLEAALGQPASAGGVWRSYYQTLLGQCRTELAALAAAPDYTPALRLRQGAALEALGRAEEAATVFGAVPGAGTEAAEGALRAAAAWLRAGHWAAAATEAARAGPEGSPRAALAKALLAQARTGEGRLNEALRLWDELLADPAAPPGWALGRAQTLLLLGRAGDCRAACEALAPTAVADEARFLRAFALQAEGRWAEATAAFGDAAAAPGAPAARVAEATYRQAAAAFAAGQWAPAAGAWERRRANGAGRWQRAAAVLAAEVAVAAENDGAVPALLEAVAAAPGGRAVAVELRARWWARSRRTDALADLWREAATDRDLPGPTLLRVALAAGPSGRRDWRGQLDWWGRALGALAGRPEPPDPAPLLARWRRAAERLGLPLDEAWRRSVGGRGDGPLLHWARAQLLGDAQPWQAWAAGAAAGGAGRFLTAEAAWSRLAKGDATGAETLWRGLVRGPAGPLAKAPAWHGLAELARRRGQPERAADYFALALGAPLADGRRGEAALGWSGVALAEGQFDLAADLAERVLRWPEARGGGHARALANLAEAWEGLGRRGEAVAAWQRLYLLYPAEPAPAATAYAESARLFELLGDRGAALRTWRELAEQPNLGQTAEFARATAEIRRLEGGS